MSAIQLVNQVSSSTAPSAEFHVYESGTQLARIGVHAGGTASVATVVDENNSGYVNTALVWQVYAIVNGITTQSVTTADPNATVNPAG